MNKKQEVKLFRLLQQQAGVSRRKAQELIAAGEVEVNGAILCNPFAHIYPEMVSEFRLRGHPLSVLTPDHRIYRYNKPTGVLCTHDDPHYGRTVGRRLRAEGFIGYSWAGRLDQDAEGLILLTNDGHLVHRLTHPRYQVAKVYHVWPVCLPKRDRLKDMFSEMQRGIEDSGETLKILGGEVSRGSPRVTLTLTEGKKNEIKRLFSHFNLEVSRLRRVKIGPIDLGDLPFGAISRLDTEEVQGLYSWLEQVR
ncbi:MAG: pseudouridine synthase [Candidatus Bipolaricaulota bacterium]|nr:pseudouridine synthase [Candidatus Bipolaricaulota bacterium]